MDLEFKIKDSAAKPKVVRVAFNPPLAGYEEVKPRLLGMKADADEALGTVRDPFAPPDAYLTTYICLGPYYRSKPRKSRTSKCRSRSGPPARSSSS